MSSETIENSEAYCRVIEDHLLLNYHSSKKMSRKDKWNVFLTECDSATEIVKCINVSVKGRPIRASAMITDLYSAISKDIHKPDDSDVVLIRQSLLYKNQVS